MSIVRAKIRFSGEKESRIVSPNPRDATALACLAKYRANLGQAIEAARRLEDALRIRPDDPELNFYGVVVCERLGDRAGAVKYFRKSLAEGYSLVEFQNNPDLADFRRDPRVREALAGRG